MNAWESPWNSPPSLPTVGASLHAGGLVQSPSVLLGNLANDAKWGEDDDDSSEDPGSSALESKEAEESTAHASREVAQQSDSSALWATTATQQITTSIREQRSKTTSIVNAENHEGDSVGATAESRQTTQKTLNPKWKEPERDFFRAKEPGSSSICLEDGTGIVSLVEAASNFASAEPESSPSIRSHCEPKSPETPRTSTEDEDPRYSPEKEEIYPAPDEKEGAALDISGPGDDDDFGVLKSARGVETPEAFSPLSETLDPTGFEDYVAKLVPEEHLELPETVGGVLDNYEIKLKPELGDDSEHLPVAIVSEISPTDVASLFDHQKQQPPVVKQSKSANDFIEQFLAGHGRDQQKSPDIGDSATSTRAAFAVDLPIASNLLPISSEIEAPPEPDTTIVSSTSERKTWYRISRTGTVKEHDTDDIDNYVRVTWPGSAICARVVETVERWARQDRSIGGITMFGNLTGRSGIKFDWTEPESQESVYYNSQTTALQEKVPYLSGLPPISALPSSPPIVLKTRFSWTSSPPENALLTSTPLRCTPDPNLSFSNSPESKPDPFRSPALSPALSQHDLRKPVGSSIPDDPGASFAQFQPPPSPPTAISKSSQTQHHTSPPKATNVARENHREPSTQTDASPSSRSTTTNLTPIQIPAVQLHTNHKPRSPSTDSSTSFSSFTASTEAPRPETVDLKIVNSVVAGLPDLSYMLR